MTLEECYAALGGDYADAIRRLGPEERLRRYLLLLPQDDSMHCLTVAWHTGRAEEAHRAAHTLCGLALTLGLTRLAASAGLLADSLRHGHMDAALFAAVQESWRQLEHTLAQITE